MGQLMSDYVAELKYDSLLKHDYGKQFLRFPY